MSFWRQFGLVLWKNYILQRRKLCVTIFEITLPVLFAALLVFVRYKTDTTDVTSSETFTPFNVDGKFQSLYAPRVFAYAPDTPVLAELMAHVSNKTGLTGIPCKNEDAVVSYAKSVNQTDHLFGGVIVEADFQDGEGIPLEVKLKIRPYTENGFIWVTEYMYTFYRSNTPRTSSSDGGRPGYDRRGFLDMEYALVSSLIEMKNTSVNFESDVDVRLNMMPYPPYHRDSFLEIMRRFFSLLLMLSFILNTLQSTKNIVHEKERRLKESMKMMGLSSLANWSAWFVKCFIYLFVAMVIFTLLFMIPVGDLRISVLGQTDPSLFFVFLVLYAISIVAFCFCVSTFFTKANAGAAAGGILFFLTYVPYFFLDSRYESMSQSEKLAACILPNVAMALGANLIGLYEGTGEGASWTNFHNPATIDDNFSLLLVMVMLLVDTAICLLITWYVDTVFPGEYGVPQPWYFPVSPSYWRGMRKQTGSDVEAGSTQTQQAEFFEKEPTGMNIGIQINKLRKEFGSGDGKKVAVAGISLNMYRGQITALLGHNGAGKTTTMSMLTGFLPPTSGTANVKGFDIRHDIANVRKGLGLCPQHDILFDTLTVREHMIFFAKLKGCPSDTLDAEVDRMIDVVGLTEKTHAQSQTLSGGQKRKLSVGIALVGGSEIIILDEPTSGMDPEARRQMWTILQQYRAERTILLTTHYMDEADILGDRIAIMAEGVIKCCGSSLFLKNKYGSGYHLTFVKEPVCNVSGITELIKRHIPMAVTDSDVGAELTYILPNDQSPKFEKLFEDMEKHKARLGIASFGVSVTTMEEVFLRVGESAVSDPDMMARFNKHDSPVQNGSTIEQSSDLGYVGNGSCNSPGAFQAEGVKFNNVNAEQTATLNFNRNLGKNVGIKLHLQQFRAVLTKKILHTWRNRTITTVQLLLPVFFTSIALLVVDKSISNTNTVYEPEIALDMSSFRSNKVPYGNNQSSSLGNEINALYREFYRGTASTELRVDLSEYKDMDEFFVDLGKRIGFSTYSREYLIGAYVDANQTNGVSMTGYFNGQLFHSVAISFTAVLETMYKLYTGAASSLRITNFPLPENKRDDPDETSGQNVDTAFVVAFCISFGMAFLASSFVMFPIKEKSTQSKHIQIVSGLKGITYWLASFIWDYINYLIPCFVLLIVFASFGTEAYVEDGRLGIVFLVLLLYGWAVIPFVYVFHFLFSSPATGMVVLTVINIFTGLATLLAVFLMPHVGLKVVSDVLDWLFTMFLPNFCLGEGFLNIFINYLYREMCTSRNYKQECQESPGGACCDTCTKDVCFSFEENYLAWTKPGIGAYVTFMFLQGVCYFTLVIMIEYGIIRSIWYKLRPPPEFSAVPINRNEDNDVSAERQRISHSGIENLSANESLVLDSVTKSYGGYVAVERLSVGVPQNECFGLLGVNGAGKTSTFKMLTGEEMISDGNARLNGCDVKTNIKQVQSMLGYCPQFDALIDQMTGRETLTMFARLRGIRENRISGVVNHLMETVTLSQHADKLAGKYSGGNKRKLSTAIALIGDPPVIFLDEPTTGVDPAARRQLWNVLSEVRASGRTLILTSHSMEECDALCTRLAIMVNGRFLCLGSPQHLKNKFGQGYSLIARIASTDDDEFVEKFATFIQDRFPQHEQVDAGKEYVNYHLTDPSLSLSFIFGTLERAKAEYNIEDYSVSQTTLQQIFIDFARKQVPPREDNSKGFCKSLCCCCSCC